MCRHEIHSDYDYGRCDNCCVCKYKCKYKAKEDTKKAKRQNHDKLGPTKKGRPVKITFVKEYLGKRREEELLHFVMLCMLSQPHYNLR